MTERDDKGRFCKNNTTSASGGRARAAKLPAERRAEIAREGGRARMAATTPEERKAIARKGFMAVVNRHFGGDVARAIAHLTWIADRPYWGTPQQKWFKPEAGDA